MKKLDWLIVAVWLLVVTVCLTMALLSRPHLGVVHTPVTVATYHPRCPAVARLGTRPCAGAKAV